MYALTLPKRLLCFSCYRQTTCFVAFLLIRQEKKHIGFTVFIATLSFQYKRFLPPLAALVSQQTSGIHPRGEAARSRALLLPLRFGQDKSATSSITLCSRYALTLCVTQMRFGLWVPAGVRCPRGWATPDVRPPCTT